MTHHPRMSPTSEPPVKAGPREWVGLAVLALPCLVYSMDLTVLNFALPALSAAFKPSATQLLWMVDIYGFMVAALLITMGTLGDRYGRRRLLMIGAAAFAAASVVAAFAPSADWLVAARALLGVAGATVAPSTMSLIRNMFHDERERQFAIGVWVAAFSAGGAVGPLVSGVLLQYFWWGSVFLVAVPVMLLVLLLGPRLLPEYRDPQAGTVDATSVVLSMVAVLTAVYGLKQLAEHGFAGSSLALLLAGCGIGLLFVRRQRQLAYPLIDTSLFGQRRFGAALAAYALAALAMFGVYVFITQYLQLVLQLSALKAGVSTLPWSLAFLGGALLVPLLTKRLSERHVLVGGLVTAAAGFALLTQSRGDHALAVLIAASVLMSLGMAPVFTVGNDMLVSSAPAERAGSVSALAETVSEFSAALGIAVFGSLGALLYRLQLSAALPAGVPPEARATLGGAVALAQAQGGPEGQALADAARAAFSGAVHVTAAVAAAIVLMAAVLVAVRLRGAPRPA